jgi:hypothetical protein
VIKNLKVKQIKKIQSWLGNDNTIPLQFPNDTDAIIENIFFEYAKEAQPRPLRNKEINSPSKFRNLVLKKIFSQLET